MLSAGFTNRIRCLQGDRRGRNIGDFVACVRFGDRFQQSAADCVDQLILSPHLYRPSDFSDFVCGERAGVLGVFNVCYRLVQRPGCRLTALGGSIDMGLSDGETVRLIFGIEVLVDLCLRIDHCLDRRRYVIRTRSGLGLLGVRFVVIQRAVEALSISLINGVVADLCASIIGRITRTEGQIPVRGKLRDQVFAGLR